MGRKSSTQNRAKARQAGANGPAGGHSPLTRREARGAFVVALGLISFLALMPGAQGRPTLIGWDKLDHVVGFAALALLMRAGWPLGHRWIAALSLFAYGLAIELAQGTALVGRTASISDLVANGVGIALGLGLAFWLARLARTLSWLPRRR
jgi:VanZ family protein